MRFLSRFLGWLALVAIAYLALVRAVDPRGEFGTHWLPPSINNARVSKQDLFARYSAVSPVEGLVLGSSRSMQLSPRRLEERTHLRFFNFAVNDGTVEDFLAIFRWVSRQDQDLRHIIIGVDGYALFNGPMNDDLVRNETLLDAFLGYPEGFPSLRVRRDRDASLYGAVFALPYLKATLYSLALQTTPGWVPPATFEDPDGVLREAKIERRIAAGTFQLDLPSGISSMRGYFERPGPFSEERRRTLEQLVREARDRGIQVTLWMTCLHPVVIESLARDTPYLTMLATTRSVLDDLSARYGADVHDLSAPDKFGGLPDGFFDGGHIDPHNATHIVDALTEGKTIGL
jgi:hypothetical protein